MKRRQGAPRLRLSDLSPNEEFDLQLGWMPHAGSKSRWQTWRQFLDTYQCVQDELEARPRSGEAPPPFAELARGFAAKHGLEALERADFEQIVGDDIDVE